MGHVHLHVPAFDTAEAFYCGQVGFEPTVRGYPGALFVAAGGYHHHLGMNTWVGVGAPRRRSMPWDYDRLLSNQPGRTSRVRGRSDTRQRLTVTYVNTEARSHGDIAQNANAAKQHWFSKIAPVSALL